MVFSVKALLGCILALLNIGGLCITVVAFYAVLIIAKQPTSSSIYIMAATNLTIDLAHLLMGLVYLAPSIIFDSFFFEGDRDSPIVVGLGTFFLFCWYYGSIAQILVAFNRLVVLCLPKLDFFTSKRVLCMMLGLYPVAAALSIFSQYLLPCCNFSFNHVALSYSYRELPGIFNYANGYIDLWLNSTSSGTCLLFYTIIIFYVHHQNQQFRNVMSQTQQKQRRMREYRYALQFLTISIFYLFSWTFFRIYPLFMAPESSLDWFGLIPMAVAINSSANGLIYLISNKEVKSVIRKRIGHMLTTATGEVTAIAYSNSSRV